MYTVKWYPHNDKKAFCMVKSTTKESPYMDKVVSHDTLVSNLKVTPHSGINPGLKRRGFNTSFDPSSGLGLALGIVKSIEEQLIHALVSGNEAQAMKEFPDEVFETSSMAIFSSFPDCEDYLAWSKGEQLELQKIADPLEIDSTTKIHRDYLNEERDTRALLVNNLTGLRAVELFSDNFKEDQSKKASALAMARLFLPNIKYFIVKWMAAKMKLRREILHQQDNEPVRILLKSNMWDPSVFPTEAIEKVRITKFSDGIRNKLNLDKNGGLVKKSFDNSGFNQRNSTQNFKRKSYEGRNQKNFRNKKYAKYQQKDSYSNQEKKSGGYFQRSGDKGSNGENSTQNQNYNKQRKNHQKGKNNKKNWKNSK